jgi:hypothetical protein
VTGRQLTAAVAAIVAAPLLAYPLVVLASGAPPFPGDRGECARVAHGDVEGRELELVAAHVAQIPTAEALRDRLVAAGFSNMQVKPDGCGRWKVTNDGIDSFAQGVDAAAEVRRAGYDPRLELDPAVP